MDMHLPVLAGAISSTIFVGSYLPMLVKAARTKDLRSYSLGQIALANVGNLIHSIYILHLPLGPIWLLHGFYLVSTAMMLIWYLRYSGGSHEREPVDERPPHRLAEARAG